MLLHRRFIQRQIASSLKQTTVFILCVMLSLVTLVALGGFGESVNNSLLRDARRLLAGDLLVQSSFPYSEPLAQAMDEVAAGAERALLYEFVSVVRTQSEESSLLTSLKIVEGNYPFYGEVELLSGRPFAQVLRPGAIIVEQNILDRLNLQVGDSLYVGSALLLIDDVVTFEPDRPVAIFSFGPRIFIHAGDLPALDLIKPGSRVTYKTLFKFGSDGEMNQAAEQLEAAAMPRRERISTYQTNESPVQRFFENFLTFLRLIGIFTLLLAGIGIQSSLTAFLKEREQTIAILRTLGAKSGFILGQFMVMASFLGGIGLVLGITAGVALQWLFPLLFANFLPPAVELTISFRAIGEAVALGLFVVLAFTFLPLYQLQELKPSFIFQKESSPLPKGWLYYAVLALILLFFTGMVFWYLQNTEQSLYFAGGVLGLIILSSVLTYVILWLLRRRPVASLAPRQAVRGLFRPRNATLSIIVTLSASLAVLFSIYLIQNNLRANFVQAYPPDAPNMIVLDIQPDQQEGVAQLLAIPADFTPLINGRLVAVNGVELPQPDPNQQFQPPNEPDPEDGPPPQLTARPFTLTYRPGLLEFERLTAGDTLFASAEPGLAQVSVEEELFIRNNWQLGDTLTFNIQGVEVEAQITSVRQVNEQDFQPRFTFVLREQDLQNAPQTIFTSLRLPPAEIPALQNKLVAAYPNLTVINISETVNTIAGIVNDITSIIRFFTLFSILAGILILISSILATRFARIQEAVYFKVLGAKGTFVLRVFALENIFLGLISASVALLLSQIASYLLMVYLFEIEYTAYWLESLALVIGTVILVTAVGLLASLSILQQKPILFLRQQTEE